MKGPLSADKLFFISSFSFVVSFVLYALLNYFWPISVDAIVASSTPTANVINQISWILSIAGVVTFILGFIAKKS